MILPPRTSANKTPIVVKPNGGDGDGRSEKTPTDFFAEILERQPFDYITFDYLIDTAIGFDTVIIVMLEPNKLINENVFGVSYDGRIMWQIDKKTTFTMKVLIHISDVKTVMLN